MDPNIFPDLNPSQIQNWAKDFVKYHYPNIGISKITLHKFRAVIAGDSAIPGKIYNRCEIPSYYVIFHLKEQSSHELDNLKSKAPKLQPDSEFYSDQKLFNKGTLLSLVHAVHKQTIWDNRTYHNLGVTNDFRHCLNVNVEQLKNISEIMNKFFRFWVLAPQNEGVEHDGTLGYDWPPQVDRDEPFWQLYPEPNQLPILTDDLHLSLPKSTKPEQVPSHQPEQRQFRIEFRQDKGVDVYFDGEKSLVTGMPALFLYNLIQYQGKEIYFRFFSDVATGTIDLGCELKADDIYEKTDNISHYQKALDNIYSRLDNAIGSSKKEEVQNIRTELNNFEKKIVKKILKGSIDDDGQIIIRRRRLKKEASRAINTLSKRKKSLLEQLQPSALRHFKTSINVGVKVSYLPEHPINWDII